MANFFDELFDFGEVNFGSGAEGGTNAGLVIPEAGTSGGSFDDWLASLPSASTLAPLNESLQKTGVGPNLVPYLWLQFAPFARSQIASEAQERLGGVTTGLAAGREEYERGLLDSINAAGVDPLFAKSQLAENAPRLGEQIAAARGNIRGQEYEDVLNLMGGVNSALAQAFSSERELGVQAHFADLSRQDAIEVARSQSELARQQGVNSALNPFGGGGGGGLGSLFG